VNDIIKEHATLLKDATGYRVLIPDLYKGKIGVDKEEAHHVRLCFRVTQQAPVCLLC
jgi:carboxymethylenebutenolidase